MKMAIYRQRQAMSVLEHTACIRGAVTETDLDLIDSAVRPLKPVLLGLAGETAIIKPFVEGDDVHSFEALYDIAITGSDLRR